MIDKLIEQKNNEIEKAELMLLDMQIQEWIYTREYADPVHISKIQAMERMGQCQSNIKEYEKHITLLKEHLIVYDQYKQEHKL